MSKYKTDADIVELVRSYEACSISRDEWRHAEHLVVALYLVKKYGLNEAIERMRSGLLALLRAYGVDLEKEMPYHETLTVFWMRTVYAYALTRNGASLADMADELVAAFDKDYPLRFYSRDRLFSDAARAGFVEPDLVAEIQNAR